MSALRLGTIYSTMTSRVSMPRSATPMSPVPRPSRTSWPASNRPRAPPTATVMPAVTIAPTGHERPRQRQRKCAVTQRQSQRPSRERHQRKAAQLRQTARQDHSQSWHPQAGNARAEALPQAAGSPHDARRKRAYRHFEIDKGRRNRPEPSLQRERSLSGKPCLHGRLKQRRSHLTSSNKPPAAAWLAQAARSIVAFLRPTRPATTQAKILVVVEGPNDIEFLRRISAILHRDDPRLPDLTEMERQGSLVFAPTGGVDLSTAFRYARLGLPEFHLLDRDIPPVTQTREQIAAMVNSRPRCHAVVTSKRSLENFLHRDAIFEASGFSVEVTDDDDLPALVACRANERHEPRVDWNDLSARARKRLHYKAKRWLNTKAVERMTPERLAERDPGGELRGWVATIASLTR